MASLWIGVTGISMLNPSYSDSDLPYFTDSVISTSCKKILALFYERKLPFWLLICSLKVFIASSLHCSAGDSHWSLEPTIVDFIPFDISDYLVFRTYFENFLVEVSLVYRFSSFIKKFCFFSLLIPLSPSAILGGEVT